MIIEHRELQFKVLLMPLTSYVPVYCCKYSLSSMTTVRWWKVACMLLHLARCPQHSYKPVLLPIPVPDVLFMVHVSTMWTTALGRCQTLCAVHGHDGRSVTCTVIKFSKQHTLITHTHMQGHRHCIMHTNECTDVHAVIQMGLLTGRHIGTWT